MNFPNLDEKVNEYGEKNVFFILRWINIVAMLVLSQKVKKTLIGIVET